jgi:DNA-binding CsgD family transcriptional regulator
LTPEPGLFTFRIKSPDPAGPIAAVNSPEAGGREGELRVLEEVSSVPTNQALGHQGALIGRIYDAALDDSLWSGVTTEISRAFGATSTALLLQPSGAGSYFLDRTANFEDSVVAPYEEYYWEKDVWATAAQAKGLSAVYMSKDIMPDREFERTEYYCDWCRKADVFHVIGSVFPVGPSGFGLLGIHRVKRLPDYEESDRSQVGAFLPHLERALKLRTRLAQAGFESAFSLELLERLKTAVFVVDALSRVVYANGQAQMLVRAGSPLRIQHGKLTAAASRQARSLADAIRNAVAIARGEGGRSSNDGLVFPREHGFPVLATVAPMRASGASALQTPLAFVFVNDPEAHSPSAKDLQHLFDLTPAEAFVAGCLAAGRSVEEICSSHGVTANTVRTHVKRILSKTNTSRQGELVSLLLRSVSMLGAGEGPGKSTDRAETR